MSIINKVKRQKRKKRSGIEEPRPGARCSICAGGTLVYDSCLRLRCTNCRNTYTGAFT